MFDVIFWVFFVIFAITWLGVVLIGPPFVPTLKADMQQLFHAVSLTHQSHVVDLGAGDGRVLATAARQAGSHVSGIEINPFLVAVAWLRLRKYKGSVTMGDMWRYRLPDDTTHVFVFPAEMFMNKLERYLSEQRKHTGPLVVMLYGFRFPSRKPEKSVGAFNLYRF